MLRMVLGVLLAVVLSVLLTLGVVNIVQVKGIEKELETVNKKLDKAGQKLTELAEAADKSHAPPLAHGTPHWGYDGALNPAKWGDVFPVCGSGKSQSPVDIRGPFVKATNELKPSFKPATLKIVNNGHTLQVNVGNGSKTEINGESYELLQFHFHRPSEEHIEGKPMAMVAHFVHKSAAGKLAVIGVLLSEGAENEAVKMIWANAPKEEGPEKVVAESTFNPAAMLPKRLHYYSFEGSLTTPPCTEGVTFYILKTPMTISRAQIDAFPFKMNARPVQPLNGRHISAN
jgi:carbonic anhydrase